MNWFIQALKRIFTYRGRARRAEFGWFNLIAFLINLALTFTPLILFGMGGSLLESVYQSEVVGTVSGGGIIIFTVASYLFSIVTTLVQFSLTCRRLHDLGYSGWWQLAVYLGLPIIVFTPTFFDADVGVVGLISILAVLCYLIFFLVLFFKDGQRFTNKYGEDPKAVVVENPVSEQDNSVQGKLVTFGESERE